jgi:hypothetical protein
VSALPPAQFNARLEKIAKEYPRRYFAPIVKRTAEKALHEVVKRSPIGDPALWKSPAPAGYKPGTFINNWFVEVGGISARIRSTPDPSGSASLNEISNLESLDSNPFVKIYVHNSLPYAHRLENGWSTQAPMGMVALTVTSLRSRVL